MSPANVSTEVTTLAALDRTDPAAADAVRAQLGWPPRNQPPVVSRRRRSDPTPK